MIKHIKLNQDNIQYAIEIQHKIFGSLDASKDYEAFVNGENDYNYFLVYDGDTCIGVSGIYHIGQDYENAWLGWFGILPEKRRNALGSDALRLVDETARDLGFRTMRVLISDDEVFDGAQKFFKCNGYHKEEYKTPRDPESLKKNYYIFSKNLFQEPLEMWDNKNLNLGKNK